jgi:curli biogenesis system outer membrane secretion channel CsgG
MQPVVLICFSLFLAQLLACVHVTKPPITVESNHSRAEQRKAQLEALASLEHVYKRKVAIARFGNETRYGRSLLRDDELDPLGKQASDMLMSRLVESGQFIVLERPDLARIQKEQQITKEANIVGCDALIIGSLTEFGRSTAGKSGFLSKTKKQIARAKVEVRLVDVTTGHAFFSTSGIGEAVSETGEISGFGSRAAYDASLNDRAIAAAISDLMSRLVSTLRGRQWRTDILQREGTRIFISGGKRQGLKKGDVLILMRRGRRVKSNQSGFFIELPSEQVAEITLVAQFGDSEINEGSIGEITSGSLPEEPLDQFFVSNAAEVQE